MFVRDFLECGTLYSLSKERLLLGVGPRRWSERPCVGSEANKIYFYSPDFFLTDPEPWFTHSETREVETVPFLHELLQYMQESFSNLFPPQLIWKNSQYTLFKEAFLSLKTQLAKGYLKKAVPYIFENTHYAMDIHLLACCLSNAITYFLRFPTSLYGFWDASGGILGATPEMLFSLKKRETFQLKTMACAGTGDAESSLEELLGDNKLYKEHEWVVLGILEALKPYGNLLREKCQLLRLPGLSHLMTPITLEWKRDIASPNFRQELLKVTEFCDIIDALHPTAALGAYPRETGNRWLKDYQQIIDRKRFGAPVGVLQGDTMRCDVAIRNIQWDPSQISIGAGCGVVLESTLESEWNEIERKLQAVRNIFF